MSYALTWLPKVLMGAGLKVALVPGWESRGRGEMGRVRGVMCHHTVGGRQGNMPSLGTLVHGRAATATTKALSGPLAQLGLGRDGTFYVVAAGRANHAGEGVWNGLTSGNASFIGIEGENAGAPGDMPWPGVQTDAYQRGVAALLQHVGASPEWCCAHREYAPKRKPNDPRFDMNAFRLQVQAIVEGRGAIRPFTPMSDDQGRPTLVRGARDQTTDTWVAQVQNALGVVVDGRYGPQTEAQVRVWQADHDLVPDGRVGPKTWAKLLA